MITFFFFSKFECRIFFPVRWLPSVTFVRLSCARAAKKVRLRLDSNRNYTDPRAVDVTRVNREKCRITLGIGAAFKYGISTYFNNCVYRFRVRI